MIERRRKFTDDVRIGPLSVFALIAILSMAILVVLSISTANASLVISQKQASAIADSYLAEEAAQDFMAEMDAELAGVNTSGGSAKAADVLEKALPSIAEHARKETNGQVIVDAAMEDGKVEANFSCAGARTLAIEVTVMPDATLRVDRWSMTAIQHSAEPAGALWKSA